MRYALHGPVLLLLVSSISGPDGFDLLIRGGMVVDPKNSVNAILDVAIKDGKIAKVAQGIAEESANVIVEAEGLIVTPGLVDIHMHVFFGIDPVGQISNGFWSLPPDGFTFPNCVTTVVDAGSSGWRNFGTFKEQVIDRSQTRVLAMLNIVGSGMKRGAVQQNLADMDPKLTAIVARENPEYIVGVKLAHYQGPDWEPVIRTVAAGELANIPVMIDFGNSVPELSLEKLLMEELRPGDVFTHTYGQSVNRTRIVDESGRVRSYAIAAHNRGIIFDVGHGRGSFHYDQAVPAIQQGFRPDVLGTDLWALSMNAGLKDMMNLMSKFSNLGLELEDVIQRTTWNPAKVIKHEELGNLSVGSVADIAIMRIRTGNFGFVDAPGKKLVGTQKFECEMSVRGGEIVWDSNGMSRPMWSE